MKITLFIVEKCRPFDFHNSINKIKHAIRIKKKRVKKQQ
jgi:hypothetical protein